MNRLNALTEFGQYEIQLESDRRHKFSLISSAASHTAPHKPTHTAPHKPIHAAPHKPIHTAPHKPIHTAPHKPTHTAPHKPIHAAIHTAPHKPIHTAPHKPIHTALHKPIHTAPHKTNGQHTIHSTHHNIQHGNSIINNSNTTINNANSNVQHVNTSTYNENRQYQGQAQEPSEILSKEYKLDPQPKWGGPQKQSAKFQTGKMDLDAAVTFSKVGLIKTRKRFSGNESSNTIFEMFVWCTKNGDKVFFKRLFDYTNWELLDVNKPLMYTTYETSIVTSVVSQNFVYAMNLLLENREYIRLSAESIRRLGKMKASLSTLG